MRRLGVRAVSADEAIETASAGELRLLEPAVRASREALEQLLDPGFAEIGSSGARWDRESIIAALTAGSFREPPSVSDMTGRLIAPGIVHLTFTTEDAAGRVHRSSLWRRDDAGWRLCFHQGTPAAS